MNKRQYKKFVNKNIILLGVDYTAETYGYIDKKGWINIVKQIFK